MSACGHSAKYEEDGTAGASLSCLEVAEKAYGRAGEQEKYSGKAKSGVVEKYLDRDLMSLKTTNPIKIMGFVINLRPPSYKVAFYL
ncbi:hypothetical protein [Serratia inhibens]